MEEAGVLQQQLHWIVLRGVAIANKVLLFGLGSPVLKKNWSNAVLLPIFLSIWGVFLSKCRDIHL